MQNDRTYYKRISDKVLDLKLRAFGATIFMESPPVFVVINIVELSFLFVIYKKLTVSYWFKNILLN